MKMVLSLSLERSDADRLDTLAKRHGIKVGLFSRSLLVQALDRIEQGQEMKTPPVRYSPGARVQGPKVA